MDRARDQPGDDEGVSTLELFFDLAFVFTITQLTRLVADEPTSRRPRVLPRRCPSSATCGGCTAAMPG
ncbi:MAG: low temperature requirement protein A [Actinomycetota bacterium]|nr:low temperature requirement protein A [Actinomycetota bacterium]